MPSGIWAEEEYDKLLEFDGETWEQSPHLFLCHQRTGELCAGWVACHGTEHLLALRMHYTELEESVWHFKTDVPVFGSGSEAREHGLADIDDPGAKARRMIDGIDRKRKR